MNIFTMGFTKKSAEVFFKLIKMHKIELLIDVRLNNQSQLSGFSKGRDLSYFLPEICNCAYEHEICFAPSKEILDSYKKGQINWEGYVKQYLPLIEKRNVAKIFREKYGKYNWVLFLCSEPTPDFCHRRLLAEYLQEKLKDIEIVHI